MLYYIGGRVILDRFFKILMDLFSSLPWLFLTSIFFTVISFHFVRKIVDNVRSGLFFPILFGVVNGVIATTMETMVDKNLPYVIMFFVPLAVVLEVFCVSKNPDEFILSAKTFFDVKKASLVEL